MTKIPRVPWSVLLLVGLAACGADSDSKTSAGVSVSDSAGVRIVTSASAAAEDTVRPVLLWEHGAAPSDYPFASIGLGVLRDDSAAVVVAARSRELVSILPGGETHAVLARRGQGPSEVRGPRQIVTGTGNEVWLEDVLNGKLLRFAGDSLLESLSARAISWEGASLMPIGVDSVGRLLVTSASYNPDFDEAWLQGTLAVFDASTSSVDTVGFYDYIPRVGEPPVSPFGSYGVVSVADGHFVTARTDRPRVLRRSADGTLVEIFEWDDELRYPSEDDWNGFRAELRRQLARPDRSSADVDVRLDDMLSDYELDTTQPLPLFNGIIGSESGNVWIAPFTPRQAATTGGWRVAGRDGGWLGVVEFARPIRILRVSDELILGVHTDELGVQTIAVYGNPFGA